MPSTSREEPHLGDLAQGLRDSVTVAARAAARVSDFLFLTLPEWRPRFPPHLGWTFNEPARLDVWGVFGSQDGAGQTRMNAVARVLHGRGFCVVTIHDHDNDHRKAISCSCKERAL